MRADFARTPPSFIRRGDGPDALHEPEPGRLAHGCRARAGVELSTGIRDVTVHGVLGENELGGDLSIGQPVGDETQDFELARGDDPTTSGHAEVAQRALRGSSLVA